MTRRYAVRTRLGSLIVEWSDLGLALLSFGKGAKNALRLSVLKEQEGVRGRAFLEALARYFGAGEWRFGVPLDLSGGTEFDREVWRALGAIPAGKVRTYGEVAQAIGKPRAARAVGNACGRNPVAIVIPCHRVVAAGGIGGFGAGLAVKRKLLALEGVCVQDIGTCRARRLARGGLLPARGPLRSD